MRGRQRWRPLLVDGLIGVALFAGSFVPGLSGEGIDIGDLSRQRTDVVAVSLWLVMALGLVPRRRVPVLGLCVAGAAFSADQLIGYRPVLASLAVFGALYSVGAHTGGRSRLAATVGMLLVGIGLCAALHGRGSPTTLTEFASFLLVLAGVVALGAFVQSRQQAAALRAKESARAATASERGRIARELHDVVTHHVTAVVVQADAAAYATDAGAAALRETLATIAETGRRALADLRHQLDVLGDGEAPTAAADQRSPAVGDIRQLVRHASETGLDVAYEQHGEPPGLDDAVALAGFRVVQEALTNALKHAPDAHHRVLVEYADDGCVAISAVSTPSVGPRQSGLAMPSGSGRGLTGLRARLAALHGDLSAGPEPDGGFAVRARIPAGGRAGS
jgi:signal transduction histidine kinase